MKPIFGTTMSGTETIIGKWLNGSKESKVNKPETKYNMAKETIEKYIEDNF
jgi:hypothetical protein